MNLRTPGPIPLAEDVLEAMSWPMINHRGPEYEDLLERTTSKLKQVFDTRGDMYIITGSGTAAMEAAVVNTLSPGDRVLNLSIGAFGDRFGQIAGIFGADVTNLTFTSGTAVDPDRLRQALSDDPQIKAVLVTHNETSTGVANDLEAIAGVAKGEFDKLLLVDGISSVASLPLMTDAWGCDVVASASQKGWMLPPGLAFMSFSERAWQAHAEARMPRFYFDVAQYESYLKKGQPPYTPAISVMFALDVALDSLLDEGMGSVYERHAGIGRMTRAGIRELGLSLFPEESVASDTVTAVTVPEGVDGLQAGGTDAHRPRRGTRGRAGGADREDLPHRSHGPLHGGRDTGRPGRAGEGAAAGRLRPSRRGASIARTGYSPRRRTLPGVAPVCLPSAMIGSPATSTYGMPSGNCLGTSKVARSATVSGSNSVRSATRPSSTRPRLFNRSLWAGRPVILWTAVSSDRTPSSRT